MHVNLQDDKIKNNCSIIIKYFTSWFGICLWCIKVLKNDKHYITVQHSPLFSHVFIFHINPYKSARHFYFCGKVTAFL